MKISFHNINKRTYHKPSMAEVTLDTEITLVMATIIPPGDPPPLPPDVPDSGPASSIFNLNQGGNNPSGNPFGGTRPDY